MAYSEKAWELRRCSATRSDGEPCRAFAMWGDPRRLCSAHGGRTRGPDLTQVESWERFLQRGHGRARYTPCTCEAYNWPHRPGGGLCRWPDPPAWLSPIPAGTHRRWRWRRR